MAKKARKIKKRKAIFASDPVEAVAICKKCGLTMTEKDRCACRRDICFRCCECHTDCDLCNCSRKNQIKTA